MFGDRIRAPWLVPLGLLLAAAGLLAASLAQNYALVATALAVGGLGVALFHPEGAPPSTPQVPVPARRGLLRDRRQRRGSARARAGDAARARLRPPARRSWRSSRGPPPAAG